MDRTGKLKYCIRNCSIYHKKDDSFSILGEFTKVYTDSGIIDLKQRKAVIIKNFQNIDTGTNEIETSHEIFCVESVCPESGYTIGTFFAEFFSTKFDRLIY